MDEYFILQKEKHWSRSFINLFFLKSKTPYSWFSWNVATYF